jgi:hypothetical protein
MNDIKAEPFPEGQNYRSKPFFPASSFKRKRKRGRKNDI